VEAQEWGGRYVNHTHTHTRYVVSAYMKGNECDSLYLILTFSLINTHRTGLMSYWVIFAVIALGVTVAGYCAYSYLLTGATRYGEARVTDVIALTRRH
jgi:hypothetical protein